MKIPFIVLFLSVFFFCQSSGQSNPTRLTTDISIRFPDKFILNESDSNIKIYLITNDSFQIFASVVIFDEIVRGDSVKKIERHDANAFKYCERFNGMPLKTAYWKKHGADYVHFDFQSTNDTGQLSKHTGLIIYHKKNMVFIDFISNIEDEKRLQQIRNEFYKSISIN